MTAALLLLSKRPRQSVFPCFPNVHTFPGGMSEIVVSEGCSGRQQFGPVEELPLCVLESHD